MHLFYKSWLAATIVAIAVVLSVGAANAQSGNATSVTGTVLDSSGAVVSNATLEIHNPVSGFDRTTRTDASGSFSIQTGPFNPYHFSVTGQGFAPYAQDIDVRSGVPLNVSINLNVAGSSESVTVEGAGDLVETDQTV